MAPDAAGVAADAATGAAADEEITMGLARGRNRSGRTAARKCVAPAGSEAAD
jgi:hypothetical protein